MYDLHLSTVRVSVSSSIARESPPSFYLRALGKLAGVAGPCSFPEIQH